MRLNFAPPLLAALVIAPAVVHAQGPNSKKNRTTASAGIVVSVSVFSSAEKKALSDYYVRHPVRAKPLPPGVAKNLGRGKPLPPGIAKTRLPPDASKALPPRQDGAEIVIFGDKVVLLAASGLVIDILEGILG
jgi:hypothetical protein